MDKVSVGLLTVFNSETKNGSCTKRVWFLASEIDDDVFKSGVRRRAIGELVDKACPKIETRETNWRPQADDPFASSSPRAQTLSGRVGRTWVLSTVTSTFE
ncbi:jg11040 [Pararge aegeria aegeria]|uniref:Jg11040 protein n=1 Tax=Pararge aegeria aegeria TaxID=348720 RepID=A0A8S4QY63_9NEOP|nr:jg11040 [Pararge aegeria aegeria]